MRVFTSFRNRLLLLILVFSLFTFLFAGVNTSSYLRQRENVLSDMQTIDSAYILLVQDSKAITDFLFNAHSNSDYHTTGQSPFLLMHKGHIIRIESLVGRIGTKTGNDRLGADSLHTQFRILLHALDSKVDTAARLILRRGYKDWGMEGLMRGHAHRLETMPGIDLSHVLTLRRHEKDYIIRNEPQYVVKFNSYGGYLTEVYRSRKNLSRAMRDSIVGSLESYLRCFNTMVELNHRIGLREPQGVVHGIDDVSSRLFESFDSLKRQVQLNVDAALGNLQKRFVVINILILSLASYLGYYMASQFTRPLIDLSLYISRFVRNGFKPSGRFPQANCPDEVGLLISNFRVLRNEIVELIKDFTAKVEQRTHEIYTQKQAIQAQMEEIESQRDELSYKTRLIEEQRDLVVSQNRSIIDSLMFAKRIQDSMLPDPETLRSRFPESFVLNMPKDIVSGDFYWMWEVNHRKQRVVLFAVADCTGHGVPGAFMSIVGHNGLTLAVRDYRLVSPASILTFLNSYVFDTLHHERESGFMKNGMDIGLMAYYTEEQRIDYAGAFIPLYHVAAGVLHEIPGDKIVIGRKEGSIINGSGFSNRTISLTEGDCVYMATDGYADQFGGANRAKYKNRQLRNLLKQISTESIAKQKEMVLSTHKDWKGNFMQIDDILVFGMRVVPFPGKQASPRGHIDLEPLSKNSALVTPTNCLK